MTNTTAAAAVAHRTAAPAVQRRPGPEEGLTPYLPPELRQALAFGTRTVTIDPAYGGGVRVEELRAWEPEHPSDELRDMAEAARQSLLVHMQTMPNDRLGFEIGLLLAHRWRNRPDDILPEVQEALIVQWIEDLREFPAWAIMAAIRDWRRHQEWHPTIAGIRRLCEDAVAEDRRTLRLIERLLAA